jgi:hypothetical protein
MILEPKHGSAEGSSIVQLPVPHQIPPLPSIWAASLLSNDSP